jgi:hypothetical protein
MQEAGCIEREYDHPVFIRELAILFDNVGGAPAATVNSDDERYTTGTNTLRRNIRLCSLESRQFPCPRLVRVPVPSDATAQ